MQSAPVALSRYLGKAGLAFVCRSINRVLKRMLSHRPSALASDNPGQLADQFERTYLTTAGCRASNWPKDRDHAVSLALSWLNVLPSYDIVQGYATDGIIPLYCGFANFTAYEHGTLREIPFEDTTTGRLCNFTYKVAPRVFVTNTDVLPSVARLGIPRERVVYLPHAFNDRKLRDFRDAHPGLRPAAGEPVFFSPTRHHWKSTDGSLTKGNDIFLKAAGAAAAKGHSFRLVLVEWGLEVELSKQLIASLGLADRVSWVAPMNKKQLWTEYCRSHAVVDQFTLPAIGGVAFETLALGRRLITRIDEATLDHFFGKAPPVLNGATVDEVEQAVIGVCKDPEDHAGVGGQGRAWIETYHSAERTVALQVNAYRQMLEASPPLRISGDATVSRAEA